MFNRNRYVSKHAITSLDLVKRVELEAQITDARVVSLDLDRFRTISLDHYAAMFAWRRYLFGFLGNVQNKRVLDIGCGYSMTPVMFAMAGASVVAVDVAPKTLDRVVQVAQMRGVADRIQVHCGPVEALPFPDQSFDILYGGAALHHLQLDQAGRELSRLLRPGGRGGFQDPLGHNLLLEFARDNLNYRHKHPVKGTDKPLRVADIDQFGRNFAHYFWRGFDLLAMSARAFRHMSPQQKRLEMIDQRLFAAIPFLQRYARFSVICVTN